tara:strand:+ start:1073 stop:1249 length:177 start_codon:yes stop_codon:yes gene_type:complete
MKEIKKSIWKSKPDDDYNFEHIVRILIQKDGWVRIPLFTGQEKLSDEKWWERIKDVRF